MSKRKVVEFITDPSSDQLSGSRLLLMVLILVYLPALVALEVLGVKLGIWSYIAVIVGSVAGVYGVNSAGRVWREGGDRGFREGQEHGPPSIKPPDRGKERE
jgi:hypothetical protein